MGIIENDEINKVVSVIKEHSIKTILDMEKDRDNEEVIKELEELFEEARGALCEQLAKLPVLDLTEDCGEVIERDGKLNADIYVSHNENEIMINANFWPKLMEFTLNSFVADESHYIEFSCFDSEETVINEVKDKLENFELNNTWNNQIWIKGKLNDSVRKLILENYLTDDGKIKWFVIILNSDDKKSKVFNMAHYGTELYISGLLKEEIKTIEDIFGFNKASISWSEH